MPNASCASMRVSRAMRRRYRMPAAGPARGSGGVPTIRRVKRFLRSRTVAVLAAAACAALASLAWFGVPIESPALRDRLAAALGERCRAARCASTARCARASRCGRRPSCVASPWRIPPGFGARDLATVGELRLAVDLLPLLRRAIRVRDLAASDIDVRLERRADGTPNWSIDRPAASPRGRIAATCPTSTCSASRSSGSRSVCRPASASTSPTRRSARRAASPCRAAVHGRIDAQRTWSVTLDGHHSNG